MWYRAEGVHLSGDREGELHMPLLVSMPLPYVRPIAHRKYPFCPELFQGLLVATQYSDVRGSSAALFVEAVNINCRDSVISFLNTAAGPLPNRD